MTNNNLKHQGEVLIPAIAYGDAAGLPVETRSAEYIADKYPGGIQELIATHENPYYAGVHEPGLWSDDTQLSMAVAKALIETNRFDIDMMAVHHIVAYDETPTVEKRGVQAKRGWGGSTTGAMEKLKAGVSPRDSGTVDGAGNGVLMKMAPLVYWQTVRDTPLDEAYEQYDQLTTMTHDSDVARLTTRVHGDALGYLLTQEYDRSDFLDMLDDSITTHEFETGQPGVLRDSLQYLRGPVTKDTILARTDAKGFYAPQTLAMAYGVYMAHDGEFTPSVYGAVNIGGDTDSIASIVATMSVFKARERVTMPVDHQNLDQLSMLKTVSRYLMNRAFNN